MNELKVSLPQQGVGAVNGSCPSGPVPSRVPGDPAQSLDTTFNIRGRYQSRAATQTMCRGIAAHKRRPTGTGVGFAALECPGAQLKLASDAADITPLMAFLNIPTRSVRLMRFRHHPAGSGFGFQNFNLNLNLKLGGRDLWATNLTGNAVDGRKFTFQFKCICSGRLE